MCFASWITIRLSTGSLFGANADDSKYLVRVLQTENSIDTEAEENDCEHNRGDMRHGYWESSVAAMI